MSSYPHQHGLCGLAGFPVGSIVDLQKFNDITVYRETILREFNSITSENVFKAGLIHPEPGFFSWKQGDALASFCENNNLRLHGHTLIWGEQLPQWLREFQGTRDQWTGIMKEHIQEIVRHYSERVEAWDVVNEAFTDNGNMNDNIWQKNIGDDYFELAFTFAAEADPRVKLFYNDFSLEYNEYKRRAVLNRLMALRENGIRIDGIGIQMHCDIYCRKDLKLAETFSDFSKNGFLIHLSELDVSINPFNQEITSIDAFLDMQAELYVHVFSEYLKIPRHLQYGITLWGVGDNDSWIRHLLRMNDHPLLFDDGYQEKPALYKLRDLLRKK